MMNDDLECQLIQRMSIAHLMKCVFDDFSLNVLDCAECLEDLGGVLNE